MKSCLRRKTLCAVVLASSVSLAQADVVEFDDLEISGHEHSAERTIYEEAGAVSHVGENHSMGSLDSVVRALPGSYTNIDPTQGTLSINLRGLSGMGRVNTMIDGVPQTFYGTSSNSGNRFHDSVGAGYAPSSQFGVMIDPNFVSGLDITRGFGRGAAGVNGLAGSADIHTLGVNDVLREGRRFGALSKLSSGSNGMGESGMLTLGVRGTWGENGSIAAIAGVSGGRQSGSYRDGAGADSERNDYTRRLSQRPQSWLSKIEIDVGERHDILLSGSGYRNTVGGRRIERESFSATYHLLTGSAWLNPGLMLASNKAKQRFADDAAVWALTEGRTRNDTTYLNLYNSSYFEVLGTEMAFTYGASQLNNRYTRRVAQGPEEGAEYAPFSPTGKQTIESGYLEAAFMRGIYQWDSSLVYSDGSVRGFKPDCAEAARTQLCFPRGPANINVQSRSWNASTMFSLRLDDWFMPFVSYSRSTRIPNPQEVFFNNQSGGSMNPFLRPEKAETSQLGFNTAKQHVLLDNDFLGVKVVAWRTRLKDYIHSQSFYLLTDSGRLTNNIDDDIEGGFHAQIYTNSPEAVRHKGLEININYDAGLLFTELAYSYQRTGTPVDATAKSMYGFGTPGATELPRHFGNLTVGARMLDRRLTVGSTFRFTGKAKRVLPASEDLADMDTLEDLPQIPTLVDLFAHYQWSKNLLLKASVRNATNRNYVEALNSLNSTASQSDDDYVSSFSNTARGRTWFVGAEIRY